MWNWIVAADDEHLSLANDFASMCAAHCGSGIGDAGPSE